MKECKRHITGIDVVCAQGADTFNTGHKGIEVIKEEIYQTGSDSSVIFYVCYNKKGDVIAEISANTPIIIKRYS